MNNLPMPKQRIIGHRGVAGLRPENTMCGFDYAAELGLDWIEFDVLLSLDDRWVVIHDDTLDRTTTGRGLVRKWTSEDITNLNAGLWFKPPYPEEKVPTLESVLRLAQTRHLFCDIEIKGAEIDYIKYAELMADFLADHPTLVKNNILVTSFTLQCLIKLRELAPDLPIGLNVDQFNNETIALAQAHNFANINCDIQKITRDDLLAAQAANIPVFLFTVNDQSTANFWLNSGVSAIFTDRPDLLLD